MVLTAGVEPGIRLVISKLAGTARLRSVSKWSPNGESNPDDLFTKQVLYH